MNKAGHRRLLPVIIGLVAIAGCGADGSGDEAAPGSGGAESSTVAATEPPVSEEPPPAAEWVTVTDPGTGMSFALPGEARKTSRPAAPDGSTAEATMYQYEVRQQFGLSVTFSEAEGANYSAAGLREVADLTSTRLEAAGAKDLRLTDDVASTVDGHPVLDYQLSFVSGSGQQNVWFVRSIGAGSRSVTVQSIGFTDIGDEATHTEIARYHEQLVGSLRFP